MSWLKRGISKTGWMQLRSQPWMTPLVAM